MLTASSLICMNTHQWPLMWLLMEINSLGFVVLLSKSKKKENTICFFLFQSFASVAMTVFIFLNSWMASQTELIKLSWILILSVMVKMGMFPFQSWMVEMVKKIKWATMMVLLSWQKIIPMVMMYKFTGPSYTKETLFLSMLFMGVVMLKTTNTKKMLNLSSMVHMGWVLIPLKASKTLPFMYIMAYSIILSTAMHSLKNLNMKTLSSQIFSKKTTTESLVNMLSLASIPPTAGFFLKMTMLYLMIKMKSENLLIMMIILTSTLSFMLYYLLFLKSTIFWQNTMKKSVQVNKKSMESANTAFLMMPTMMMVV